MNKWYNNSGKPLSSYSWLEAHHIAKTKERKKFAKKVTSINPKKIVDLGCGPGFWLDTFDKVTDRNCEFIGIDLENSLLENVKEKSKTWKRKSSFIACDIEKNPELIPSADIYLVYNIFSYIKNPYEFLYNLKEKLSKNGIISIRQYDGSLIRFGPMPQEIRHLIENSLKTAIGGSDQFYYFDLDRVYKIIQNSNFKNMQISFELFERTPPFPESFLEYYRNTVKWTINYLSENAADELKKWYNKHLNNSNSSSYFIGVDLVASLS